VTDNPNNHGGARPGAGRKPVYDISHSRITSLRAQKVSRREIARRFKVSAKVIERIEREIEIKAKELTYNPPCAGLS
jgi:DNA invertase Pin-like site-specific DNA recombinase